MNLQARISTALAARQGLTQAGLARSCGISRASVNAWVRGPTDSIDGKYLTTAAAYLGVNPHWLATGNGEMLATNTPPAQAANVETLTGSEQGTLSQALATLAHQLQNADDLSREQAGVLLKRLASEPERAQEIAARLASTLSSGHEATSSKPNQPGWSPITQTPGFLPKK